MLVVNLGFRFRSTPGFMLSPRFAGEENDVSGHVCREHMPEGKVTYRIDHSRGSSGDMKQ